MNEHGKSTGPRRQPVPVLTVVLMATAVLCPVVLIILYAFGWQGEVAGPLVLTQPVLGVVGAVVASLHRRLTTSDRIGWAIASVSVGVAAIPLWWYILVLLYGP